LSRINEKDARCKKKMPTDDDWKKQADEAIIEAKVGRPGDVTKEFGP